jgi:hypothetical protein
MPAWKPANPSLFFLLLSSSFLRGGFLWHLMPSHPLNTPSSLIMTEILQVCLKFFRYTGDFPDYPHPDPPPAKTKLTYRNSKTRQPLRCEY